MIPIIIHFIMYRVVTTILSKERKKVGFQNT